MSESRTLASKVTLVTTLQRRHRGTILLAVLLGCWVSSDTAEANDDISKGRLPDSVEPYARLIGDLEAIRIHNLGGADYHSPYHLHGHVFELAAFEKLSREQKEKYLIYKFARSRFDGEKAFFLRGLIESYAKQHPHANLLRAFEKVDRKWLREYCVSILGSPEQFDANVKSFLNRKLNWASSHESGGDKVHARCPQKYEYEHAYGV